jgi:dolichol kinase
MFQAMATELHADRALVVELHQVLSEIDPVRWRDDAASRLGVRLKDLQRSLDQRARLASLAGALRTQLPHLDQPTPDTRTRWLAFKKGLVPAYEAVATSLRAEKIHVPTLRPTNWARSVFHFAGAALAIVLIQIIPTPFLLTCAAGLYAGTFWFLEIGRRRSGAMNTALMKFFKPIAHAHEARRVNSSTWYATALVLLTLTHNPILCLVAVGILGAADPMAAFIGRRFGKVKLLHGRSLEGSLTFVAVGAATAFGLLRLLHPELALGAAVAVSLCAAVVGAAAELLSLRIDDNLSVPLASAAGAAIALALI